MYVLRKIEDHEGYFKFFFLYFLSRNTLIAMSLSYLPLSSNDLDKLSVGVTHIIKIPREHFLLNIQEKQCFVCSYQIIWKTLLKKKSICDEDIDSGI